MCLRGGDLISTEEFKRRLTAILSADVEGYSQLMRDDEEATVRTITSYRTAMTHLIQQYRGRVVDSPGDNILAEFTSVVDGVNCAVEIQRELAERNQTNRYKQHRGFLEVSQSPHSNSNQRTKQPSRPADV